MTEMNLLIATTNPGKVREYAALFGTLRARLLGLRDVGLEHMDVEETADTFAGNAELKARAYAAAAGLLTLADDSGLLVDALGGAPGVQTARYAGPGATDAARYTKLLAALDGLPDAARTARFMCAIALVDPRDESLATATGTLEGRIAHAPGETLYGFGFDPVFIPDGYAVVLSALPPDVKNTLSHRGQAARAILPALERLAAETDAQ